jgi:hypothetical protein
MKKELYDAKVIKDLQENQDSEIRGDDESTHEIDKTYNEN